jgi:thiamine pyrophosphokinase
LQTIVIANGMLSDPAAARALIQPGDRVIAADGGAAHCLALGLVPDLVVGDFDSLSAADLERLQALGARLEKYPARKDETDLELALRIACAGGAQPVLVLGALGSRWDMSLANILLLAHPDFRSTRLTLVDGPVEISLAQPGADCIISGAAGDTVSLIPLQGDAHGVVTDGLEYPLLDETLQYAATRGVSNVLLGTRARVGLKSGLLLCVVCHQDWRST